MHDLLIDAANELAEVAIETSKLVEALALIRNSPDMFADTMGWLAVQGVASAVEKIYSGCERHWRFCPSRLTGIPLKRPGHGIGRLFCA
jgi:hypothetical protein